MKKLGDNAPKEGVSLLGGRLYFVERDEVQKRETLHVCVAAAVDIMSSMSLVVFTMTVSMIVVRIYFRTTTDKGRAVRGRGRRTHVVSCLFCC